ncbi:MAG: M20/M25/M40 family metallo-hydrolase [Bacteroides sp.]|nr:MAG: M20/M25/M40 family metallo-hydrolase [Bacteroides sp.]
MNLDKNSLFFLENYINNFSPVSQEYKGQILWLEYIKKYIDQHYSDYYGNTVAIIKGNSNFKFVIEAHADEISWYVNHISDDGFIYVIPNGGSDCMIAPSKKVLIHTKEKGLIKGVFGWPAIHFRRSNKEKIIPSYENIFIDTGFNNKKNLLKAGVSVGDIVTYEENFSVLNNNYYVGRAFDNRIGGFIIAEVAKLLSLEKITLPFDLYIVNSVQEEIGLKGAKMIANKINPDIAIITDVTHDTTTPMIDQKRHGNIICGKGPVLTFAPSIHNILNKYIENFSLKYKIPIQKQACSYSTGTDTDSFAYTKNGIPSSLISLPLRYMHTTVEMIHISDVKNCINLLFNVLKDFDINFNLKYF